MTLKQQAHKLLEEKIEIIRQIGFQISDIYEKSYNYEVEVIGGKDKLKVQVYFGKKGVKTILQGNKESELYKNLEDILSDQPLLRFAEKDSTEPAEYIGTDESGKGDLFGPLVTAAVFINEEKRNKLLKLGVKDSKELNDKQIDAMAPKIETIVEPFYVVVKINPQKYNELYEKFRNLNKLLMWSHSRAIENLLKKVECREVITDKFSNENYKFSDSNIFSRVNFQQITKAEKFTGVAAASILARHQFNVWFRQKEFINFNLPKGASKIADEKAKEIKETEGIDFLKKVSKIHFKNIQKL